MALGLCCITGVYLVPAGCGDVSRQHQELQVPGALQPALLLALHGTCCVFPLPSWVHHSCPDLCNAHCGPQSAAQHGHPGVTQPQGQQSPYKQGAQTLFPFSLVQGLRAGLGCAIPVLQAASAPPEPPVFASAGRRAAQLQQAALCAARG